VQEEKDSIDACSDVVEAERETEESVVELRRAGGREDGREGGRK
jgi:hypothetical protein